MKAMYGNVPVKSLHITKHDVSTNDATLQASDMQAGVTAYARGQKITGTGKCFEFAQYGGWSTNFPDFVPDSINVIQIGSIQYPVKMIVRLQDMKAHDFSVAQEVAEAMVDGVSYPIIISVQDGVLDITCEKTIDIELFYGKDKYI